MVKNWGEEKMNWRGGRRRLKANFTDGFTDGYKINYYFNLFRRWCFKNLSVNFEFRTKMFNCPPYFSQSVGKSVGNLTRSEMHLMHNPLVFAQSVGNCVGYKFVGVSVGDVVAFQVIIFELSVKYRRTYVSRYGRRWCGGITSNCFRTLCGIPTDIRTSVWPSVMWWHYQ